MRGAQQAPQCQPRCSSVSKKKIPSNTSFFSRKHKSRYTAKVFCKSKRFFSTSRFAARYFISAPPVFQRLFFTSEEAASIQYGPRRMKLRDLMGATLRFLQSDCEKFRVLWDWSVCISQLLTSDVMVRGYACEMMFLTLIQQFLSTTMFTC